METLRLKAYSRRPWPPSASGDRITTEEMARRRSSGAAIHGIASFEARGSGMGEYMKNMKERIWLHWFPYIARKYPRDFKPADALLSFTLDAKGEVKRVEVLKFLRDELFATYCTRAIQEASGFGPLPDEIKALIGKEELELKFAFHYR